MPAKGAAVPRGLLLCTGMPPKCAPSLATSWLIPPSEPVLGGSHSGTSWPCVLASVPWGIPHMTGPAGHWGNSGMPPPARLCGHHCSLSATSLALLTWGKPAAARGGHCSSPGWGPHGKQRRPPSTASWTRHPGRASHGSIPRPLSPKPLPLNWTLRCCMRWPLLAGAMTPSPTKCSRSPTGALSEWS